MTRYRSTAMIVNVLMGSLCLAGHLQIKSEPGVTIFLDGDLKGITTPDFGGLILQDLPGGTYTLKAVKEGFQPQTHKVRIGADEIKAVVLTPFAPQIKIEQSGPQERAIITQKTGTIIIQTLPIEAKVLVASLGINVEKTNDELLFRDVPVGTYAMQCASAGKTLKHEVTVYEGVTSRLFLNFVTGQIKDRTPKPVVKPTVPPSSKPTPKAVDEQRPAPKAPLTRREIYGVDLPDATVEALDRASTLEKRVLALDLSLSELKQTRQPTSTLIKQTENELAKAQAEWDDARAQRFEAAIVWAEELGKAKAAQEIRYGGTIKEFLPDSAQALAIKSNITELEQKRTKVFTDYLVPYVTRCREKGLYATADRHIKRLRKMSPPTRIAQLFDGWRPQHLIRTLEGHTAEIDAVDVSSNGKLVVTGSRGPDRCRLWDFETGACLRTITGHSAAVTCVAFSPDNRTFASASRDHICKLWDVESGSCLRTFKGHDAAVTSLAFSPDGLLMVSAGEGGICRLWNTTTGACVQTLEGHEEAVTAVAFNPNGYVIASASRDRVLKTWSSATGQCLGTEIFQPLKKTFMETASEGNATAIWLGSDGRATVAVPPQSIFFSSRTVSRMGWIRAAETFHHIVRSSDGYFRVSGDTRGRIAISWSGTVVARLQGHTGCVRSITVSDDDRYIISAGDDKTCKLWEFPDRESRELLGKTQKRVEDAMDALERGLLSQSAYKETLRAIHHAMERTDPSSVYFKVLKVDQNRLGRDFASHLASTAIEKLDASGLNPLEYQRVLQAIRDVEAGIDDDDPFHMDRVRLSRHRLCYAFAKNRVDKAIVACRRGELSRDEYDSVRDELSKTTESLKTDSSDNSYIGKVEACKAHFESGLMRKLDTNAKWVKSVIFSSDSRYIACAGYAHNLDGMCRLYHLPDGECIQDFHGHKSTVSHVVLSEDNTLLVSASVDRTCKIWDVASGSCLRTLRGHSNWVNAVAFSPDNKYILSASEDKTCKLWDIETGQCLRTFGPGGLLSRGHTRPVQSVTFSPDGRYILSGSEAGRCKLWENDTGKCVKTFTVGKHSVDVVSFNSQDRSFCAGGAIWDVDTGTCLQTFEDAGTKVSYGADGKYIVGNGLWESETGRKLLSTPICQCSPDERYGLVWGFRESSVEVYDLTYLLRLRQLLEEESTQAEL